MTHVGSELVSAVYPVVADVLRPEEPMSLHHPVGHVPLLSGQTGGRGLGVAESRARVKSCLFVCNCLSDGLISHIHLGKSSFKTGGPLKKKKRNAADYLNAAL